MADQKKLEESAKKALKKARQAVATAEAKAQKASKKRRSAAAELRSDLTKTTAKAKLEKAQLKDAKQAIEKKAAAAKKSASKKADAKEQLAKVPAASEAPAGATTSDLPLPHEVTVDVPGASGGTESSDDLSSMTMIRLRVLAREKRIVGYSRLSKADLVSQLQEA